MVHTLNQPKSMISTISEAPVGTGLLAFRDLPKALNKTMQGKNALDFGCGAGRSSRFLKNLGFDVTGVDISEAMINEAKRKSKDIDYRLIHNGNLKAVLMPQHQYDVILVSFVTMEVSSLDTLIHIFKELTAYLNSNGQIVVIAASDNLYSGSWLSINTDYPHNKSAKSGDIVKVFLNDYNLEISDYYWKEKDCEYVFQQSGLRVAQKSLPLGSPNDNKKWLDELKKPPFVIYYLRNL